LFVEAFVSGIDLSRRHYEEVVRPLVHSRFRALPHSAALLGRGSEVLGYDDEMSTDHDWGPRVLLFVSEEDFAAHGRALQAELDRASSSGSGDDRSCGVRGTGLHC
jgi:hypothetical protein